jgi:calcium-translocating P-type ATPase
VVKRLSAVETLGSTTVICSDKTGTITANRMQPVAAWIGGRMVDLEPVEDDAAVHLFADALAHCATVSGPLDAEEGEDPTELATMSAAQRLGQPYDPTARDLARRHLFPFQSALRLMSTVDESPAGLVLHLKGAPEAVLDRSTTMLRGSDTVAMGDAERRAVAAEVHDLARRGLRVLAVADRRLEENMTLTDRTTVECDLRLLGLVALLDPPRPEVAGAITLCHEAGLRVHMVTGDNADTATEVARQVGIGSGHPRVITGADLGRLDDAALVAAMRGGEVVFARTSPEDKLRLADVLHESNEVVAMTGDGVNDAPALRRADIGVAMGRNGTDVAREAATAVLSDDNFATIVAAIEEGRRVYDNVRKFILYIFAHAVPEVVPFLVFALSGGAIPLPLTVLQILAIDLGTETLPALALGREPAEPGLMSRPPRRRGESVVTREMLVRAWGVLGGVSAVLVMIAFFWTLVRAGWHPGDATGAGSELHHAYLQATTATFAAIVACQVGTAAAARTEHASLRSVGVFSNRMLLWGIAFELLFTAALVYLPQANQLMDTAPLPIGTLVLIAPFPLVVWGVDELRRARRRR